MVRKQQMMEDMHKQILPMSETVTDGHHSGAPEQACNAIDPSSLRYGQFCAFDIFNAHLDATFASSQHSFPQPRLEWNAPPDQQNFTYDVVADHF